MDTYIFWTSLGFLLFTYIGYPIFVFILERLLFLPIRKKEIFPSVSIIISCYNEAKFIKEKIKQLLKLEYPSDKLEIIVASDGSTDQTTEILKEFSSIKFINYPTRRGKPSVFNDCVKKCKGEILVFLDARQHVSPNLIKNLVRNFADPQVGGVSGELILQDTKGNNAMDIYWRYEKWIRKKEAGIHSCCGATGAVFAIRKNLYKELPPDTILDDVVLPLFIIDQGYRVVFEEDAKVYDKVFEDTRREFIRKRRTLAGNFQILFNSKYIGILLTSPWKFSICFIFHKFFRLFTPLLMFLLLISNIKLYNINPYKNLLFLQIFFYLLAFLGKYIKASHPLIKLVFNTPHTFCVINWAIISGFIELVTGTANYVMWEKEVPQPSRPIAFLVLLIDLLAIIGAFLSSFWIRFGGNIPSYNFTPFVENVIYIICICAGVIWIMETPSLPIIRSNPEEYLKILKANSICFSLLTVFIFLKRERLFTFPSSVIILSYIISCAYLLTWRLILKLLTYLVLGKEVSQKHKAVIVSGKVFPVKIIEKLKKEYKEVILYTQLKENSPFNLSNDVVVRAYYSFFKEREENVDIYIYTHQMQMREMEELLLFLHKNKLECYIVPSFYDLLTSKQTIYLVNYIPFLSVGRERLTYSDWILKRILDLLIIIPLIIVIYPCLIAVILLKKIKDPNFNIKKVERVGYNDQRFYIYREKKSSSSTTELGKIHWINALLQFLNIIKGEMSVVGPLPLSPQRLEVLANYKRLYIRLKPGLTGLSQIMFSDYIDYEHDWILLEYYIRNYSIWLDIKIIIQATLRVINITIKKFLRLK